MSNVGSSEQAVRFRLLGAIIVLFISTGFIQLFLPESFNVIVGFFNLWLFILAGLYFGLRALRKENWLNLIWVVAFLILIAIQSYTFALSILSITLITQLSKTFFKKLDLRVLVGLSIAFLLASAIISADIFQGQNSTRLVLPILIQSELPFVFSVQENLVFIFSFFAAFVFGVLIADSKWLGNYHFQFPIIQYWAKLLFVGLLLWLLLHKIGLYNLISESFIGATAIAIDFLTIQFVICALGLYLLLYTENFKVGRSINVLVENIGKNWKWTLGIFIVFVLIYSNAALIFNG